MFDFDVVVLGGGSAGFAAADRAVENGATVAIVEAGTVGGSCPGLACIPTNILLTAAKTMADFRAAAQFGVSGEALSIDMDRLRAHQREVVGKLAGERLIEALDERGITLFHDQAAFKNDHEIELADRTISAKWFIIATGSEPKVPDIQGIKKTGYLNSDEAIEMAEVPESIAVIGGGPVGVEFAQIWRRFGSKTTLIEAGDRLLPDADAELSELLKVYLRDEGIEILTATNVDLIGANSGMKELRLSGATPVETLDVDQIMAAVGRVPRIANLNLEAAGVEAGPDGISTDRNLATSVPNIWACGDVTGGHLDAHFARYEGDLAGHNATSDLPEPADYGPVPRVVFCDPEVAGVGLTESEAERKCRGQAGVGRIAYRYLGKSIIRGERRGLIKLIADADNQILGGHIIGDQAGELIHEIAAAMIGGVDVEALAQMIHAYPTYAEGIGAAAVDLLMSGESGYEQAA